MIIVATDSFERSFIAALSPGETPRKQKRFPSRVRVRIAATIAGRFTFEGGEKALEYSNAIING